MAAPRMLPCRLCGAPSRWLFRRRGHAVIQIERAFEYYECERCRVRFQPASDGDGDGAGDGGDVYAEEKLHTAPDGREDRRYVHFDRDIVRALSRLAPRGRLLDLGSGWGHLLLAAREAGWEAEGVDVSAKLAREAAARSGCPVFCGPLHEASFDDGRFTAVNAHFVLEYVSDPLATVRELARVLAPGGVLRVCSYTHDTLPARLKGEAWWNYAPTRSFIYSAETLRYLARESGLDLERIREGAEQPIGGYLRERPPTSAVAAALDVARFYLRRVRLGPIAIGSRRAFYLRKPDARGASRRTRS